MKTIQNFAVLLLMTMAFSASAQKIKWESGEDLPFIKDVALLNVQYVYSNMTVAEGTEQSFLDERKAEINKDKPGEGDEFVANWQSAKTDKYPKHFETTFNKEFKKEAVVIRQNADAKYTVVITLNNVKTGRGSAWGKKPAMLDFVITIVETANPSNVLAKGTMEDVKGEVKAPKGSGWIPGGAGAVMNTTAHFVNKEVTNRLAESFELVAIALAKQINKKR
ncbi:MAG: hypothetical protein JNJ58_14520 [Chitinophagaceae bacterium]|nr:hypothetical protein [Chitinophagaceae bacterium]